MSMTLTNSSSPTETTCSASSTWRTAELGDVNQAFDAVFDAYERTEWNQLGNLARYNLTQCVGAGEGAAKDLPG